MRVWQLIKTLQEFDDDLEVVVPTFDVSNLEILNDGINRVEQNEYKQVELWT
jgi:hypothetical protein